MYTYRLIHTAWSHLRARCQSLGPYLNIGIAVQDGGCDPTAWMASPLLRSEASSGGSAQTTIQALASNVASCMVNIVVNNVVNNVRRTCMLHTVHACDTLYGRQT